MNVRHSKAQLPKTVEIELEYSYSSIIFGRGRYKFEFDENGFGTLAEVLTPCEDGADEVPQVKTATVLSPNAYPMQMFSQQKELKDFKPKTVYNENGLKLTLDRCLYGANKLSFIASYENTNNVEITTFVDCHFLSESDDSLTCHIDIPANKSGQTVLTYDVNEVWLNGVDSISSIDMFVSASDADYEDKTWEGGSMITVFELSDADIIPGLSRTGSQIFYGQGCSTEGGTVNMRIQCFGAQAIIDDNTLKIYLKSSAETDTGWVNLSASVSKADVDGVTVDQFAYGSFNAGSYSNDQITVLNGLYSDSLEVDEMNVRHSAAALPRTVVADMNLYYGTTTYGNIRLTFEFDENGYGKLTKAEELPLQ